MKSIPSLVLPMVAALFCSTTQAQVMFDRCNQLGWKDSLGSENVQGRRDWIKKCDKAGWKALQRLPKEYEGRTVYLTYGVQDESGAVTNPKEWAAPVSESASCDMPENYEQVGMCRAGCYAADEKLAFRDSYVGIKTALEQNLDEILTLNKTSQIDKLEAKVNRVLAYTRSIIVGENDVLVFKMKTGNSLKVTPNHPVVDQEGKVREAASFQVGESLVSVDGSLDPIVSITSEKYHGRVYNVDIASDDRQENIVFANGYLNGSVRYQNEWTGELNRRLLRTAIIPTSVLQ